MGWVQDPQHPAASTPCTAALCWDQRQLTAVLPGARAAVQHSDPAGPPDAVYLCTGDKAAVGHPVSRLDSCSPPRPILSQHFQHQIMGCSPSVWCTRGCWHPLCWAVPILLCTRLACPPSPYGDCTCLDLQGPCSLHALCIVHCWDLAVLERKEKSPRKMCIDGCSGSSTGRYCRYRRAQQTAE